MATDLPTLALLEKPPDSAEGAPHTCNGSCERGPLWVQPSSRGRGEGPAHLDSSERFSFLLGQMLVAQRCRSALPAVPSLADAALAPGPVPGVCTVSETPLLLALAKHRVDLVDPASVALPLISYVNEEDYEVTTSNGDPRLRLEGCSTPLASRGQSRCGPQLAPSLSGESLTPRPVS